jgi:hypothetical protein
LSNLGFSQLGYSNLGYLNLGFGAWRDVSQHGSSIICGTGIACGGRNKYRYNVEFSPFKSCDKPGRARACVDLTARHHGQMRRATLANNSHQWRADEI